MKNTTFIFFLFSFVMVFSQITEEGLLLHYKFDNNFEDASENGYEGVNYGVTFTEDRFGNENAAASFDGVENYIEWPNLSELKPQLPVSFSFWIKYDTMEADDNYLFNTSFEEDVSSGVYFNTQFSTDKYAVNFGDGSNDFTSNTRRTYVSNKVIDDETWHHVAVIVSSATDMKIYIDCRDQQGIYLGSGGNIVYSDAPGSLGRGDRNTSAPPSYFKGSLDDFYYWDRQLSDEEIDYLCLFNPLNVEDFTINKTFLAPNPTRDFFEISTDLKNIQTYSIHSVDGKVVISGEYKSSKIDISNLSSGIYFIKIYSEKNSETLKFIKK